MGIPMLFGVVWFVAFSWATKIIIAALIIFTIIEFVISIAVWAYDHNKQIDTFLSKLPVKVVRFNPTLESVLMYAVDVLLLTALILIYVKIPEMFLITLGLFALTGLTSWGLYWYDKKIDGAWFAMDKDHNDLTEIRELLCPKDGMNMKAAYNYIPKEQRSARLWIKKVKNSFCRPMQL